MDAAEPAVRHPPRAGVPTGARRGIHYHQFLAAGENTLNYRLAVELFLMVRRDRGYDPAPGSTAT